VRTIQALDTVRDRLFSCEIWHPAVALHAGRDIAPGTQDSFVIQPHGKSLSQMAIRNAAAHAGTTKLPSARFSAAQSLCARVPNQKDRTASRVAV